MNLCNNDIMNIILEGICENNYTTDITNFNMSEHDNINVYNIAGQVVSNLLNGYMDADSYDITWNAVEMPSGVYFIKARLDGITETQKVMLIK